MAPNFLKSEENLSWDFTFSVKMRFNYMPISQRFFYPQENIKKYFLKSFIPDTKNHRNLLHRSC